MKLEDIKLKKEKYTYFFVDLDDKGNIGRFIASSPYKSELIKRYPTLLEHGKHMIIKMEVVEEY